MSIKDEEGSIGQQGDNVDDSEVNGRRVKHTTIACFACRNSKLRCSGAKPCVRCAKRGIECIYTRTTRYICQDKINPTSPGNDVSPTTSIATNNSKTSPAAAAASSGGGGGVGAAAAAIAAAELLLHGSKKQNGGASSNVIASAAATTTTDTSVAAAPPPVRTKRKYTKSNIPRAKPTSISSTAATAGADKREKSFQKHLAKRGKNAKIEDEEDDFEQGDEIAAVAAATTTTGPSDSPFVFPRHNSHGMQKKSRSSSFSSNESSSSSSHPPTSTSSSSSSSDHSSSVLNAAMTNSLSMEQQQHQQQQHQQRNKLSSTRTLQQEVQMANMTMGETLMDIFTTRHLPYFMFSHGLPQAESFHVALWNPATVAQRMQRDAALAISAQGCGHANLTNETVAMIDQMSRLVLDERPSQEGVVAMFLYSFLVSSNNAQRGNELQIIAMDILNYLQQHNHSIEWGASSSQNHNTILDGKRTNDLVLDSRHGSSEIAVEEAQGIVLAANAELDHWIASLPFVELREYIGLRRAIVQQCAAPPVRAALTVLLALSVEFQMRGGLMAAYIGEIAMLRDPQDRFGLAAFSTSARQSQTIPVIPPDVSATMLRRLAVALQLLMAAQVPVAAVAPFTIIVDGMQSLILFRSGKIPAAIKALQRAIHVASLQEMRFMPAEVVPILIMASSVYVEIGNLAGLQKILDLLMAGRNANPMLEVGIAIMTDLIHLVQQTMSADQQLQVEQQQQQLLLEQHQYQHQHHPLQQIKREAMVLQTGEVSDVQQLENPYFGVGGGGGGAAAGNNKSLNREETLISMLSMGKTENHNSNADESVASSSSVTNNSASSGSNINPFLGNHHHQHHQQQQNHSQQHQPRPSFSSAGPVNGAGFTSSEKMNLILQESEGLFIDTASAPPTNRSAITSADDAASDTLASASWDFLE